MPVFQCFIKRDRVRPLLLALVGLLLASFHLPCAAWWNKDWTNRNKVSITIPPGSVTGAVAQAPVLVRLHTGNFHFVDAKTDGTDVRFVASDDKTPLKYHVEKWDGVNELAFVWVQVPNVAPGAATDIYLYSGNASGVGAEDTKGSWDAAQVAAFHFDDAETTPTDKTANAAPVASFTAKRIANALIGGGLNFDGRGGMTLSTSPAMNFGGGFTFSAWIKPSSVQGPVVLFRQKEGAAPIEIGIEAAHLYVKAGSNTVKANAELSPGAWKHVAATVSDRLVLYVDGVEAGAVAATGTGSSGAVELAYNYTGDLDELLLANQARSTDWIKFAANSQMAGSQTVTVGTAETTEGSGGHSYFTILLKAVTLDGWIVIGILMVMLVISFAIMVSKTRMLLRTEKANAKFVGAFRKMTGDLTSLHIAVAENPKHAMVAAFSGSNLYHLYRVGMEELTTRIKAYHGKGQKLELSSQAIGAIRARLDAGLVKESHRLNSQMVLLTIAISGGPFLGLLGTVVGVMITFAAIAAAGDVNVNSIAPGIAAALVATVAGLAVAIPALFGYNYLSSRIREVNADMHVFADELVTKLAEGYAP